MHVNKFLLTLGIQMCRMLFVGVMAFRVVLLSFRAAENETFARRSRREM